MPDGSSGHSRQLPHNVDAEMALLGAVLTNNRAYERVSGYLRGSHFAVIDHGKIFDACKRLIESGRPADLVTVKGLFDGDEMGGTEYLVRLADCAATPISAGEYGKVIYDLALRRELIEIGHSITDRAYAPDVSIPAEQQIEEAERKLSGVGGGHVDAEWTQIATAMTSALTASENLRKSGVPCGIPTGLADVDAMIGGLMPGKLYVVGSRPRMGKSALAINIAVNAARKGHPVGIYSLEMDAEELAIREMARASGICGTDIQRGKISAADTSDLTRLAREMADMPLHINDRPGLTLDNIRRMTRAAGRKHKLEVVIVDYLQLVRTEGKRDYVSVGEISTGLKHLARERNIAVVALAQLNRECEKRPNKRPIMSDLRETGNLEQDADVIGFLHREEEYAKLEEPQGGEANPDWREWKEDLDGMAGLAELIIAKHRGGPTGIISLQFNAATTTFGNLARPLR